MRLTKLTTAEVNQIWKVIQKKTQGNKEVIHCSPTELADDAGWDSEKPARKTKARAAVAALEKVGFIERGFNTARVYADNYQPKNQIEARERIDTLKDVPESALNNAIRLSAHLLSIKHTKFAVSNAISDVDELVNALGMEKKDVLMAIDLLKKCGVLNNYLDMRAEIGEKKNAQQTARKCLKEYLTIEEAVMELVLSGKTRFLMKEMNQILTDQKLESSVGQINKILHFWTLKNYAARSVFRKIVSLQLPDEAEQKIGQAGTKETVPVLPFRERFKQRQDLCQFIIDYIFKLYNDQLKRRESNQIELGGLMLDPSVQTAADVIEAEKRALETGKSESFSLYEVGFSVVEVLETYLASSQRDRRFEPSYADVQEALLYLYSIGALKLRGGFLVLYFSMEITRKNRDKKKYGDDEHKEMEIYYEQRAAQVHIVKEFANIMTKDYEAALQFVRDYFTMEYEKFVQTYFPGRKEALHRSVSEEKYRSIMENLSPRQQRILTDKNKRICVFAGPGSGKTRVLTHKLASLLIGNVKPEELVMLTYSRAAAVEFRKRLYDLMQESTRRVEISTFHSYAFNLLGRRGSIETAKNIIPDAVQGILNGKVDKTYYSGKTTLVIDEAQDMNEDSYKLVEAILNKNGSGMSVIAVGDEDQAIYDYKAVGHKPSDIKYFQQLQDLEEEDPHQLTVNYRSDKKIVALANAFVQTISQRFKTQPIQANSKEKGIVRVTEYASPNMEESLVNELEKKLNEEQSVAVLTQTNEEAACIVRILRERNINAKLIEETPKLTLLNLMELRYFIMKLGGTSSATELVSDETWDTAMDAMKKKYVRSRILDMCVRVLENYKAENERCFKDDLEAFLYESEYESFYESTKGMVLVSTIHKSKGREFDQVYLMLKLNKNPLLTDQKRRPIYVGITRAKKALYIYTTSNLFKPFVDAEDYSMDTEKHKPAEDIELHMALHEVYLGYVRDEPKYQYIRKSYGDPFFKEEKKPIICSLRSGYRLGVEETDKGLFFTVNLKGRTIRVAKAANDFMKETLAKKRAMGYEIEKAEVGFVVGWRDKEEKDAKEVAVALPILYLRKSS